MLEYFVLARHCSVLSLYLRMNNVFAFASILPKQCCSMTKGETMPTYLYFAAHTWGITVDAILYMQYPSRERYDFLTRERWYYSITVEAIVQILLLL